MGVGYGCTPDRLAYDGWANLDYACAPFANLL